MEPLTQLLSKCKLPGLPASIRLGWRKLTMTTTVAYYNTAKITAAKCFVVQGHGVDVKKRFPLSMIFWTNKLECLLQIDFFNLGLIFTPF